MNLINSVRSAGRILLLGFITAVILFCLLHANKEIWRLGLYLPFQGSSGWQSYHQAVQRAAPAVVNIYRDLGSTTQSTPQLGSGIIVTASGYIVTNKHVVDKANNITVALADGRLFEARLIGSDTLTDIAVLQIAATHLPVIPYNTQRPARIGDVVLAIGNPFNLGQTVTQGIISATERIRLSPYGVGKQNFLQTDAAINRGNSGGALVNTLGELVGINTLILRNEPSYEEMPEGISFAVPVKLVLDLMRKIIRDGRVIRGYIGFDVVELSAQHQTTLGLKSSALLVKSVDTKGSADGVLKPLDIILSINGTPVVSGLKTMTQVAEFLPGTRIALTILRSGAEKTVNVTIAEYPIH